MTILSNITDLKNWIFDRVNAETSEAEVEQAARAIQRDSDRPNWGSDWTEYLETVDLEAIVMSNN